MSRRTGTRTPALASLVIVPLALVGACASGGDEAEASLSTDAATTEAPASTEAAATTRTVEDITGEITIPADPQAALGMYTTDIDTLITLGVPLAGSQPIRGDGYTDFPSFFDQEALQGIETFGNYPEYNFEAILAAEPDFILNGLGYDEDVVARLPEIAPTYSFNGFDGRDWRESFEEVAIALDREEAFHAWTDAYAARVEEVKAELAELDAAPVVAPVEYWGGQVTVTCYGVPCLVFRDLGLEISPLATAEGTSLSPEELSELSEIDAFFATNAPDSTTGEIPDPYEPLADNTLWQALPAVDNGQTFVGDMEMVYGSPSGHLAYLEFVADSLLP